MDLVASIALGIALALVVTVLWVLSGCAPRRVESMAAWAFRRMQCTKMGAGRRPFSYDEIAPLLARLRSIPLIALAAAMAVAKAAMAKQLQAAAQRC